MIFATQGIFLSSVTRRGAAVVSGLGVGEKRVNRSVKPGAFPVAWEQRRSNELVRR